ncbi:MAG TPA: hypothetical protein VI386_06105 [Candidatus Sulfotelmatobacter sp.]|jgi:hypothetical protein
MTERERYEARKAAEARQQAEREEGVWWFSRRNPIDRFTGWLVAWTALLSLSTLISAIVLYKTDRTLQCTVVATQRPWIKPSVELAGIRFTPEGGLALPMNLKLQNVGNSVATFVEADLRLIALTDGKSDKTSG